MAPADGKHVPKFSSFKARPKPQLRKVEPDVAERSKATHKAHQKHGDQRNLPESSDSQHAYGLRHPPPLRTSLSHDHGRDGAHENISTERRSEVSDQFVIDVRGDAQNVEFGTLHRYSVPAYFRIGRDRVVGASNRLAIGNRDSSTTKGVTLETRQPFKASNNDRLLRGKVVAETGSEVRIVPRPEDFASREFIPLKATTSDAHIQNQASSSKAESHLPTYRAMNITENNDVSTDDSDVEVRESADVSEPSDSRTAGLRREHAALLRSTKSEPQKVENWLRLAALQPDILRSESGAHILTNREKRMAAEVKVSIYNNAVRQVSQNAHGREQLFVEMMKESRVFKDSASLSKTWREVLQSEAHVPALWSAYMDFIQTDHVAFNFESCKRTYMQCLTILRDLTSSDSGARRDSLESTQIFVWLRYTFFLRDSGFEELSIAMWQGLLEMIFSQSTDISELERFWESDAPRIGEEQDHGHARRRSRDGDVTTRVQQARHCSLISDFAACESHFSDQFSLPVAADDEDEMDDPYCVVLFSDIQPALSTTKHLHAHESIIDALLLYLGLPPTASYAGATRSREWQMDSFLRAKTDAKGVLPSTFTSSWSLFDSASELWVSPHYSENSRPEMLRFVDRLLSRLALANQLGNCVTEYHIAFRTNHFPQDVTKLARQRLKDSPSNLRLYNAYALAQMRLGNTSKAREIWTMALDLAQNLDYRERALVILLIHSRTQAAIKGDDDVTVLQSLVSIKPDQSSEINMVLTPVVKIKAQKLFQQGWVEMVEQGSYDLAILHAECQCMLTYFITEYSLEAAMNNFSEFATSLTSKQATLALEGLHEAKMRVITWHLHRRRPYRQAILRDETRTSLSLFPNNSTLLRMHAEHDLLVSLDDRIRASLRDQILSDAGATVVNWSFILSREIDRNKDGVPGHTEHSVRNTFAKALMATDSPVRHSPALWMMWLGFEHDTMRQKKQEHQGSDSRRLAEQLRQTVLNGLRHLPWHKGWAICGMHLLATESAMEEAELRQLFETLVKRSMRIRVEFDDTEADG